VADSQWRIRDASEADLPALARLMADAPLLQRYATTYPGAVNALRQALAERDVLLVLEHSTSAQIQGFAWIIVTRAFDQAAYLRLLLVAEDAQRGGAGGRLMAAAQARASATAKHLYFMVTRDNTGARRFYERFGCRAVGDLPGHVRPDVDEVLYHKPLQ
jgi:ribosomal protein S18 acetylase RimI-like enzyme